MKISRSRSVLAVRAHPKHSSAYARNSSAEDTTQVPSASSVGMYFGCIELRVNTGKKPQPRSSVKRHMAPGPASRGPRIRKRPGAGQAQTGHPMIEMGAVPLVISAIDALGAWHHGDSYPHNDSGDHHCCWRGLAWSGALVLSHSRGDGQIGRTYCRGRSSFPRS